MKNEKGNALIGGIILFVMAVGIIVLITKTYSISPGNVGVLIYKGGQNAKGVSDKPLTPGWGMRKLFVEDVQEYPIFLQTAIWTKSAKEGSTDDESITANSKEGVPVNMDVSLSYTLDASKVPDIYVKYRSSIADIQKTYLRQSVRQAIQDTFGNYSVEQIYGPAKQEIAGKIQSALMDGVGKDGFVFTQFTINEVRLPANIMESINQKIQAGQDALKAEQKLKQIQVEADQQVAQAEGNAKATIANAQATAEAIKIQAEAIQSQGGADYVQLQAIAKWNGQLPSQMVPGSTVPFLNLTK
jgi:regulator of protease activity HflC (stomatin/prohibitin superfamily)